MTKPTERIAFAGIESILGPFVIGLFWLSGCLGVVGVLVLVATGRIENSWSVWSGVAIGVAFIAWFGWTIVRDLRRFRVLLVETDGSWTLRNAIGHTLGRVPADVPRSVRAMSQKVTMFTGAGMRKFTRCWIELSAADRTWRSCCSIPSSQEPAHRQLAKYLVPAD